ncbi:ParA [Pseudomonas sp. 8Z]|uniref:2-keto-4-pentenoate hydratase n=1 Tax=Pseudomonas sp. 8Z TaxID=2653166 RepID=UPI0012F1F587|nr:fumarylacetoacetate hydrolase family protein [Pseudomonas sp. 8Z]VXC42491.1 ParA [Pseudomonas sp. 8Z]
MTRYAPRAEITPELEDAAAALVRARQEGIRLASLPASSMPTSLAQGFAVQQRVGSLAGETVGGWKCALPPADKWIVAPIYSRSIVQGERYQLPAGTEHARIEPELACVLSHDLPARAEAYTAEQIIAAIGHVHIALEVIDCRYGDPKALPFEQLLADGLFNHGLVLGPRINLPRDAGMPSQLHIRLSDVKAELFNIQGHHPDGGPLPPIVWLANFLSTNGIGLQAGQVVITGSYAGVLDVPVNQPLHVQFGDIGSLAVHFSTQEE